MVAILLAANMLSFLVIPANVVSLFTLVCHLGEGKADKKDLVSKLISAGDSVLTRLWICVKDDKGRIDEQIDKDVGTQLSAKSLTWSYANILHSLHLRKTAVSTLEKTFPLAL